MTAQDRATNKAKFEQGDKPQGADYVDLMDSVIMLAETTVQSMAGPLVVTTLGATEVTANSILASAAAFTSMSAATISFNTIVTAMATASAITGAGQTLPNQVTGFLTVQVCGATVAIPYFPVA